MYAGQRPCLGDHAGRPLGGQRDRGDRAGKVALGHGDPRRMPVPECDSGRTDRTPGHVTAPVSPVDPCGRPDVSGNPVPADSACPVPAAVVVRGPAPGVVGGERPAPVGQDPLSIVVGTPTVADGRDPDASIGSHEGPVPVRREPLVEDGLARNVAAGGRRRRLRLVILVGGRTGIRGVFGDGRRRRRIDVTVIAYWLAAVDAAGRCGGEAKDEQAPIAMTPAFQTLAAVAVPRTVARPLGRTPALFNGDIHARSGSATPPRTRER